MKVLINKSFAVSKIKRFKRGLQQSGHIIRENILFVCGSQSKRFKRGYTIVLSNN
jgi:hypothetical protein